MLHIIQISKLLIVTLVAGLLVNVSALPIDDVEKRLVVTVVDTVFDTYTPAATNVPAVVTDVVTQDDNDAALTQTTSQDTNAATTSVDNTNSLVQSQQSSASSDAGDSYNSQYAKGALGITYSPYTESGACKSVSEVAYDIGRLSNFTIIRLYGTDCDGVENVLASLTSSQKLFLGLYNIDTASIESELAIIQSAVTSSSRGWSVVDTISVGNEQVNSGEATPAEISTAVGTTRSWLSSNASEYTGYIVSVDTLVAVMSNPELCTVSDYLAVNSHPYWDGNVEPSNSGPWLLEQIANLQSTCGGSKKVLITETGWPTAGSNYGSCVPSKENQQYALQSIVSSLGDQAFVFTMYNDYWKSAGSYGVEQSWGIFGNPAE